MSLKILPLNAPKSKSGYAFSIRRNDFPFLLLDAGCGRQGETDWLTDLEPHPNIWISHGHADHIGALPALLERWPTPSLYMAQPAIRPGRGILVSMGYPEARIDSIFSLVNVVGSGSSFAIDDVAVRCAPSGHGIGAHMLRMEIDGHVVGYTGDWALHERFGAASCQTDLLDDVEYLIAEAALSGAKHLDAHDGLRERQRFQSFIADAVPRLVVVAPFSELDEVANLVRHGDVGRVHFAEGIGLLVEEQDASVAVCQNALASGEVVVACGSGAQLTDPSGQLAAELVGNPEARIALVNRIPHGSPAERLLRTPRRSRTTVYGQKQRIRAHIQHFQFPDHALPSDLVEIFSRPSFKKIILFHAKSQTLFDLKARVEKSRNGGRIVIGDGATIT